MFTKELSAYGFKDISFKNLRFNVLWCTTKVEGVHWFVRNKNSKITFPQEEET